jgi:hypothetical protein
MSHHLVGTALGLLFLTSTATVAVAETSAPVVVVELYTSQGCSSCPPADAFLAKLIGDDRVVPLALHVDYWDYIGWKDKFADPAFSMRQHAYATASGSHMVYTPQMIVGGVDSVEGNNPNEITRLIDLHLGAGHAVDLSVERQGDTLHIRAGAMPAPDGPVIVQVVRYRAEDTVSINRGENAGRTISYHNIVTDWQRVGEWSGAEALDVTSPISGSGPAVVILQKAGPAAILAAARVE